MVNREQNVKECRSLIVAGSLAKKIYFLVIPHCKAFGSLMVTLSSFIGSGKTRCQHTVAVSKTVHAIKPTTHGRFTVTRFYYKHSLFTIVL